MKFSSISSSISSALSSAFSSAMIILIALAVTGAATPAFADTSKAPIRATLKVPSKLRAPGMRIATDVKAFLDRDFRSRYPVAAPIKVDVVDAWVDLYSQDSNISDGYGGFDTRHYFRVIAEHANGAIGYIDVYLYERTSVEPDQDRILIESFRVVGWQP